MYRIDPSQWTFLKPTDLQVGDVFLCLADGYFNVVRRLITWKTKSLYVHAAIYVEDGMLLEAVRPAITRVRLDALLRRYAHAAVLRQPDAWNPDRQCALALFASKVIAANARYNLSGAIAWEGAKAAHTASLHQQLVAYFENPTTLVPASRPAYFCSELIVDCFIATGFIAPSAAVLYQGRTYSPADLGNDPTFGTFLGYITGRAPYTVPQSDEFYRRRTFNEIFRSERQ